MLSLHKISSTLLRATRRENLIIIINFFRKTVDVINMSNCYVKIPLVVDLVGKVQ